MTKAPKEYTRLTRGRGRGLFGMHTLWLGKDHVLLVVNYGFWEDYRRFYFRDIRQVSVVKTAWAVAANAVLGGVLVCALALLGVAGRVFEEAGLWLSAWAAFTSLVLLSLNLWRGKSCLCLLQTAVQTVELKPLGRLRAATEALARLRPLIEGAQGGPVTPEMFGTKPVVPPAPVAAARRRADAARARDYGGGAHAATFALLLLGAMASFAGISMPHIGIYLADSIISMGALVTVVVALIKQRGSQMGGGLRGLTWAVMGFLLVLTIVGSCEGFVLGMRNPDFANNTWEMMKLVAVEKAPWHRAILLIAGVWSAALGIAGTTLLLGFWKSRKLQATAPTTVGGNAGPS